MTNESAYKQVWLLSRESLRVLHLLQSTLVPSHNDSHCTCKAIDCHHLILGNVQTLCAKREGSGQFQCHSGTTATSQAATIYCSSVIQPQIGDGNAAAAEDNVVTVSVMLAGCLYTPRVASLLTLIVFTADKQSLRIASSCRVVDR